MKSQDFMIFFSIVSVSSFMDSVRLSILLSSLISTYMLTAIGNPKLLIWNINSSISFSFPELLICSQAQASYLNMVRYAGKGKFIYSGKEKKEKMKAVLERKKDRANGSGLFQGAMRRDHTRKGQILPGRLILLNIGKNSVCHLWSRYIFFSDVCGAELPRWVRLKLASFGDDKASIIAFGQDVVTQLCSRLIDLGAPALHFYTLNQAKPSLAVIDAL